MSELCDKALQLPFSFCGRNKLP